MNDLAISLRNLRFMYRGQKRWALDDITLEVPAGDFLVVLGPSEAGKSTLAESINGLIPHFFKGQFQGAVSVLGRNTRDVKVAEMAERVGMVFQDFEAQLFSTKVELEVAFGLENFGLSRAEMTGRIDESLRRVGLLNLKDRTPSTLSGGQKQKLAIASALAMHPPVLVMDEPTTDLDPVSKEEVFQLTHQLADRGDFTLIVIEHDTEELLQARNVLLLREGKLVRYGPAKEIFRDVSLLESLGVVVPGVAKFFHRMGSQPIPLTPEEGHRQFAAGGWRISEARYEELRRNDSRLTSQGEPIIRCEGLEHSYPSGLQALQGIDLEIRPGEMLAMIGSNGSGKTTLVKHFNGLLSPTAGRVTVKGRDTREQGVFELGKTVGHVFQNPDHQIFSDTVFQEVAFGLRLRKIPEVEIQSRVAEALGAVGLIGWEGENPFALTKSGRQRVAVASILAARPEVLVLDEPTTGLDYTEQRKIMELLRRLNEKGHTIIFITHHMWVAAEYAHRVVVLKDGRIFLDGTPREIFSQEGKLTQASLSPPHLIRLSNRLGKTMLTAEEMVHCTITGMAHGTGNLP